MFGDGGLGHGRPGGMPLLMTWVAPAPWGTPSRFLRRPSRLDVAPGPNQHIASNKILFDDLAFSSSDSDP